MRRRHPQPPSQEPGTTSQKGPTTTRPSTQAKQSFGRCFSSRSPASPGCRRPPVLTPLPFHRPNTQANPCKLPLAADGKQTVLPTCDDAVKEHWDATEHSAVGHLGRHASTANHGGMRLYHGGSAHVGRTRDHKTTCCELLSEAGVISRSVDRAPRIPRQVDQIGRRMSPGEKTRVAEHGSQEQGTEGQEGPGKQGVRWSRCIWRRCARCGSGEHMRCASWLPATRWPGLAGLLKRSWPGTL